MIDHETVEDLREKLLQRRKDIVEQLDSFGQALLALDQSRPPEFSEEAQEEAAANSLKALDKQERKELKDIDAALVKLEQETYGICERCESEIGLPRLRALPMVRLCINCQKRLESDR
jgi:DnaK suppressor protein